MFRRLRLLLLLCAGAAVLTGCRVDVTAHVTMHADGSGVVEVTLHADAEVLQGAGGLDEDLRFDDLEAVGWEVDGPTTGDDGGLDVVLTHDFGAPGEATALIASLNGADGPFKSVLFSRTRTDQAVTFTVNGSGRVDAGVAAFADADLVAAVGATPYADDIAAVGLSQSDAVVVTLRVTLPGSVVSSSGMREGGDLVWTVPLDSTPIDLSTTTRQSLERGGLWAALAIVFQVLLVLWILACVVVLAMVMWARATRGRRGSPGAGRGRPRRPPAFEVRPDPRTSRGRAGPGLRGPEDGRRRSDGYDGYDGDGPDGRYDPDDGLELDDEGTGSYGRPSYGGPGTGSVPRVGGSGLGEIRPMPRPRRDPDR